MEKKLHTIVMDKNHKFAENDYIMGRISGILYVICEGDPKEGFANTWTESGWALTEMCTDEQWEKSKKTIEEIYPGLCEFN